MIPLVLLDFYILICYILIMWQKRMLELFFYAQFSILINIIYFNIIMLLTKSSHVATWSNTGLYTF